MIKPRMMEVPPGSLKPNPWNSNYVPPDNEAKLRESMLRFGCYKPVVVRELADGTLQILGGQHRSAMAAELGIAVVPVANLGRMDDKTAKAIGLADNGRYGEDDPLKLLEILKDIGANDAETFLPFDEKDLASLFSLDKIDLDTDLDLDGGDDIPDAPPEVKPTLTHQLLRFKVPIADAQRVGDLLDKLIKAKGYSKDSDSLAAAGMALVDIVNAAKDHL